jgi:predicted DNA-binding transcriptional regulator YafY
MPNTATRLITLIMLLQRRPNQKAAELAPALGVSVRTLHRYMGMLDDMGIPIYSERGPRGGFSLVRGYKMAPLVFSPDEAVAVTLGAGLVGEMWGPLYAGAARGALAKLDNVLPEEQRQEIAWARRSLVATGIRRTGLAGLGSVMEALQRALRERRRVIMTYRSRGRDASVKRLVDPYALVYRWGWWYAVGYCNLRQAIRSFRADRIESLEVSPETFEAPEGFDLSAFLAGDASFQPALRMRLRFAPPYTQLPLDDRSQWASVEEHQDGSVIAELAVPDLQWGAATALSYGPAAEVMEPEELRELVRQWAETVAAMYDLAGPKAGGDDTGG